jgi:hypothetical protein
MSHRRNQFKRSQDQLTLKMINDVQINTAKLGGSAAENFRAARRVEVLASAIRLARPGASADDAKFPKNSRS